MIERDWPSLTLLIGCVDNAKARQAIAETLENYQFFYSSLGTSLWWLDCVKLPALCVQHPELLIPRQEERKNHNLSCAQLALLNAQSLGINQRVAAEAAEYLIQLTTGKLKRFATYFDLISGSAQSLYTTQSSVIQAIQK